MQKILSDRLQPCDEVALGPIAQSVEQRTFNPWVDGSSPSGPTYLTPRSPEALRIKKCHRVLDLFILTL